MSENDLTAGMEVNSSGRGSSSDDSSATSTTPVRKMKACRIIFAIFVFGLAASTMVLAACVVYNPECAQMFHSAVQEVKSHALQLFMGMQRRFLSGNTATTESATKAGGKVRVSSTTVQTTLVQDAEKVEKDVDTHINMVETAPPPPSTWDHLFTFNPTGHLERQSLRKDVLVVTGGVGTDTTKAVGIPRYPPFPCQLDSIPALWGAVGGLLGHTPIICGGINPQDGNRDQASNQCHRLIKPSTLTILPRLQVGRAFAASAVVANESLLWVTGGSSLVAQNDSHPLDSIEAGATHPLDSTEFVDVQYGTSMAGPRLPQPLLFHCLIQLNPDQVLLVGGLNDRGEPEDKTYLFDYPSRTWTEGPPLNYERYGQACGSFYMETSRGHFELVALVVGGRNFRNLKWARTPVEHINMIRDQKWSLGPDFPFNADLSEAGPGGVIVSNARGVEFILGPYIAKLKCQRDRGCVWAHGRGLDKPGEMGRYFSTALTFSFKSLMNC